MLVDADALPNGMVLRAEVAVVGAGPAGLTIALELARRGKRVTLIEAGGDAPHRSHRSELDGVSAGTPFPLVPSRRRAFGGSSNAWTEATGLRVRPLDPVDFATSAARPGASWPFGRDELDPYYRRATEQIGVGPVFEPGAAFGLDGDLVGGDDSPRYAVFQFAEHDTFLRLRTTVDAEPRIELMLDAIVTSIELDDDGLVRQLGVTSRNGNRFAVSAETHVLACGAIENVRTLLESPGRRGDGVGNDHDLVGRYFMDRLSVDSGVLTTTRDLDVASFRPHRSPEGVMVQPMLWLGDEAIERHGLLNAAFWVYRAARAFQSPGVDAARRLRDGFRLTPRHTRAGRDLRRVVRGAPGLATVVGNRLGLVTAERGVLLRPLAEQPPRRDSRIVLGDRRDGVGRRTVVMQWRVERDDLVMIRRHQDLLSSALERHGVGTIEHRLDPDGEVPLVQSNYHHLGGTRMHVHPEGGVVDEQCRVHGTPNLFVAGGSVFPSGGYANPTLTIIALAIRIADTIVRDARPIRVG